MKVWRMNEESRKLELVTMIAKRELLAIKKDKLGGVLSDVKDFQRWKVKCSCNNGWGAVVINKHYRRKHLEMKHGIKDKAEQDRILGVRSVSRAVGGGSVDLSRRARLSWIKIWLRKGREDKARALAEELGVEMGAA